MFRNQLQHVILEIGRRFELREFHIIGSAAILAAMPNPPVGALTATRDVDVIPPGSDDRLADRISFVLGEASDFDVTHGYHAQGVSPETPRYAPRDWKSRAIPERVAEFTAWCMEPTDLVLSKLGAGREKDLEFAQAAAILGLVTESGLRSRLSEVAAPPAIREAMEGRIQRLFKDRADVP